MDFGKMYFGDEYPFFNNEHNIFALKTHAFILAFNVALVFFVKSLINDVQARGGRSTLVVVYYVTLGTGGYLIYSMVYRWAWVILFYFKILCIMHYFIKAKLYVIKTEMNF